MPDPDYRTICLNNWEGALQQQFPDGTPPTRTWERIDEIIKVLNVFSGDHTNHMFFTFGGGLALAGASVWLEEPETIALHTAPSAVEVVKPSSLTFNSVETAGSDWSYFRLECDSLSAVFSPEDTPETPKR